MKTEANPEMTTDTLAGLRILVIEDIAQNMRLFRAVLRLEGAEVLEANRAQAGLDIAFRERPDLILMDIQMPDMDGLTATRLLRGDSRTRAIPIVAVTASVMEADRHQTLEAGCDGCIAKPIDPETFAEELAALLRERAASSPDGPPAPCLAVVEEMPR